MDENKKKTLQNIEIAVLSILIIAMIVLIIYMVFIKKDDNEGVDNNSNNNETGVVLTNDEALTIAKSKLNDAQNFYNSLKNTNDDKVSLNDYAYGDFYYYDTEESFNRKFNDIFINDIKAETIMGKYYNGEFSKDGEGVAVYLIQNNKVYVSGVCAGGNIDGNYARDYKLSSNTNEKIEVTYKIYMDYTDYKDSEEGFNSTPKDYQNYLNNQKEHKLEIIKENEEWKISNAIILDTCGFEMKVSNNNQLYKFKDRK